MANNNIEKHSPKIGLDTLAQKISDTYVSELQKLESQIGAASMTQKNELLNQIGKELTQGESFSPEEKSVLHEQVKKNIAAQASKNLEKLKNQLSLSRKTEKAEKNDISNKNEQKENFSQKNTEKKSTYQNQDFAKKILYELKGGGVGMIHTLQETLIFLKNFSLGIINFPLDVYLFFTGKASYTPPRPRKK